LQILKERLIIFHKNYFQDFYIGQSPIVREKIGYVFRIVKTVDKIPEKFIKHIEATNGLYEIRVEVGSDIFRIFCSFDKGNLVVLFVAFQKKSQKTQRQEIQLAEKLKKEYFKFKRKQMKKNEAIRNAKSFDELLDIQHGKIGTAKRGKFETKAQYFEISETLKDARREANLTQEQLADKVGTKKSYISRIENGKCNIQLSTLYRIFEDGLGKRISLLIG